MMDDEVLMARAAWLYHVADLNQAATAKRLGITRARVNRLLAEARDCGLVSITINPSNVGLLPVEELIRTRYGLEFCICTPAFGTDHVPGAPGPQGREMSASAIETADHDAYDALQARLAFRAVGVAAAAHLRRHIAETPDAVIGTGWGRTLEQMTLQMAGVSASRARFVSLMGSLTASSAVNPFEVVHAFARTTGAEGHFLPVPFIVDTPEMRDVLIAQQSVQEALHLARSATVAYISIGELREESILRRQGMISASDLIGLRDLGAVGDTNGMFFDHLGELIDHPLTKRAIGLDRADLSRIYTIALIAGRSKLAAARGFLASGIAKGVIIDGDIAAAIAADLTADAATNR